MMVVMMIMTPRPGSRPVGPPKNIKKTLCYLYECCCSCFKYCYPTTATANANAKTMLIKEANEHHNDDGVSFPGQDEFYSKILARDSLAPQCDAIAAKIRLGQTLRR